MLYKHGICADSVCTFLVPGYVFADFVMYFKLERVPKKELDRSAGRLIISAPPAWHFTKSSLLLFIN